MKPPRRKSRTAREHSEELAKDPTFAVQRLEKELKRLREVEANERAISGLVADLAKIGFPVDSVADLRHQGIAYASAIPLLMEWLPKLDRSVKEDVVRALSVKWAKPIAAPLLIEEMSQLADASTPSDQSLAWAIGNALEAVADNSVYEDLARIVQDKRYGRARQMVVLALGKIRNPEAIAVLRRLLGDPDVLVHAIAALGTLRAKEARADIEPLLLHKTSGIRREAQKALQKIDKPPRAIKS